MRYLTSLWGLQSSISFSGTMRDMPAMVVSSDENIYFATIAKGTNGTMTTQNGAFNIFIGKINQYGTLAWAQLFTQLITPVDEYTPSIALGPNNEIFVAFITLGGANGNTNNGNIPSLCNPCATPQFQDIVVARIDELTPGNPTVSWVSQSNMCNSCGMESVPKLSVDPVNRLLYLVGQSTKQVLCIAPVGSKNIFINCIGFNGTLLWAEGSNIMNGTGENTNPVLAADRNGGVVVAWETNSTVSGGAVVTNKQIEVVKFQNSVISPGVISSYTRSWILSASVNIRSTTTGELPTITIDQKGNIYLAYVTSGTVLGGTKINGLRDLVVISLNTTGALRWVKQGSSLNKAPYSYIDCTSPYFTCDNYGNVYASLVAVRDLSGTQILPVFKFNPTTGANNWQYGAYEAYLLAGTGAPYSQFSSASNGFTPVSIGRYGNHFFTAVNTTQNLPGFSHTSSGLDFCISAFYERTFAIGKTAFEYMDTKTLCNCGGRCSCST